MSSRTAVSETILEGIVGYAFFLNLVSSLVTQIYILYVYCAWRGSPRDPRNIKRLPYAHISMNIFFILSFVAQGMYASAP